MLMRHLVRYAFALSVLCAVAPNIEVLVAARVIQALRCARLHLVQPVLHLVDAVPGLLHAVLQVVHSVGGPAAQRGADGCRVLDAVVREQGLVFQTSDRDTREAVEGTDHPEMRQHAVHPVKILAYVFQLKEQTRADANDAAAASPTAIAATPASASRPAK